MKVIAELGRALGRKKSAVQKAGKPAGKKAAVAPKAMKKKAGDAACPKPRAEQIIESEGYTLHKVIASGGFGRVWLADLSGGGGKIALKIVDGDGCALETERAALERLKDLRRDSGCLLRPDRVEYHRKEKFLFYTMTLADDRTGAACVTTEDYRPKSLAVEVRRRGRLPVPECISVARRVLEALRDLHSINLNHGDVKAENILYVKGQPMLADIGLLAPDSDEAARSGTPSYMAPDDLSTVSCDLYSVAVLMYCMATGNPAGKFPSLKRMIRDPLFKKLAHVYKVAGDRDSRKRYVSADAMIRALDHVVDPGSSWKVDDTVEKMSMEVTSQKSVPADMKNFMEYIDNLIGAAKMEIFSGSVSFKGDEAHEAFKDFAENLSMNFERRIGYMPRSVNAVCMISEASMEKSRIARMKLVKSAMRAGFGDQGISGVIDHMGAALGWENQMFKNARKLVIGPPDISQHPVIDKLLRFPRRLSFAKKLFKKETSRDRMDKAFSALQKGMDEAIRALWPVYGKYLTV